MSLRRSLPLIRAAALNPFVRFLDREGVSSARLLAGSGLSYYPFESPEQPIPFLSTLSFATLAARRTGLIDLGCQVADDIALAELGLFGQIVLHAPDVGTALRRAGLTMRHFSSHETLLLRVDRGGATVSVHFTRAADPADLHVAEQYTVMLLRRIIEASGFAGGCFRRIAFSSDPFGALETLRGWFGDEIVVADRPGLTISLRDGVLERPLQGGAAPLKRDGWVALGPHLRLSESLGMLLSTMLLDSVPAIGEVARVAGLSQRSLQRQLHAEDTSFREVLDQQRRELALNYVNRPRVSLGELSQNLGYGHQSSLTRAFRRWTDESPRTLRARPQPFSASTRPAR